MSLLCSMVSDLRGMTTVVSSVCRSSRTLPVASYSTRCLTRSAHQSLVPPRFPTQITKCVQYPRTNFSTGGGDNKAAPVAPGSKDGELKIKAILRNAFPSAKDIIVEDISGGCGSMYQVYVESTDFQGLSIVKQHQLVNKVLKQEITAMHGIRIQTQVPK